LVYGLPHQTLATAERTLHQVLQLSPDRIAAFGYAHLPSRLKHQRLIETRTLAGPVQRFETSELIAQTLTGAGYVRIGLDHFAQPADALAGRQVTRNFQGYTTDRATGLVGLGASAIGRIGDTYFQNATPAGEYIACIDAGRLATARGLKLDLDDRLRGFVIERLMCDLQFPGYELNKLFGVAAEPVRREAEALLAGDSDGLVERTPGGFRVTDRGRPFIRSLCARFDSYLQPGTGRHAIGV
jgi:oxygen-independent coproporphyrinogen-3 oxidase